MTDALVIVAKNTLTRHPPVMSGRVGWFVYTTQREYIRANVRHWHFTTDSLAQWLWHSWHSLMVTSSIVVLCRQTAGAKDEQLTSIAEGVEEYRDEMHERQMRDGEMWADEIEHDMRVKQAWELNRRDFPRWLAHRVGAPRADIEWIFEHLSEVFEEVVKECPIGNGGIKWDLAVGAWGAEELLGTDSNGWFVSRTKQVVNYSASYGESIYTQVAVQWQPRMENGTLRWVMRTLGWGRAGLQALLAGIYLSNTAITSFTHIHELWDEHPHVVYDSSGRRRESLASILKQRLARIKLAYSRTGEQENNVETDMAEGTVDDAVDLHRNDDEPAVGP